MIKILLKISVLFIAFIMALPVHAGIDLEQEVIAIPDMHNEKPYIWKSTVNPDNYRFSLEHLRGANGPSSFSLSISPETDEDIRGIRVFITDRKLRTFAHIRPKRISQNSFIFSYTPPAPGKYRFEIVFFGTPGWVDLRKDIKIKNETSSQSADDDGYTVDIKAYPDKAYAEHVTTLIYNLSYQGTPLHGIEKTEGVDMHIVSWSRDLKDFIYRTPNQNLGGPEVPVSIVFMRPAKHAVFAGFRHQGHDRTIKLNLNVHEEPGKLNNSLPYSQVAD